MDSVPLRSQRRIVVEKQSGKCDRKKDGTRDGAQVFVSSAFSFVRQNEETWLSWSLHGLDELNAKSWPIFDEAMQSLGLDCVYVCVDE